MSKKVLKDIFIKSFKFLWDDFGFIVTNEKKEDWGYILEAKKDFVGIRIEYEYKEAYVDITLYKLIKGEIVENTTQAILNNWEINGFSLGWIIKLRNPEAEINPAYKYGIDSDFYKKDGLENFVRIFAVRLKEYASDILNGDFSEFGTLDAMVKEYYKSYYNNRK